MQFAWQDLSATAVPTQGSPFHPKLEPLEGRRMFTVVADSGVELPNLAEYSSSLNDDFLDVINRELQEIANEESGLPPYVEDPLPVVPFDESDQPDFGCPGVDEGFCLPGDLDNDDVVDFQDFLKFSQNFGARNATWADGDFDGDGVVGFRDFIILAHNFSANA